MTEEVENIETHLLAEAIFKRYGYDFRLYELGSLRRRFEAFKAAHNFNSISEIIPRVLHDKSTFNNLFLNISVTVTEMFRNPGLFHTLRKRVLSNLKTYPFFNVWHAGCATGEEAYSMAIFLKEEGLLHRAQIYATDINDASLSKARQGIFPLKDMKLYTENYNRAGGKSSLSDYYTARYNNAKLDKELHQKITFSKHNLVTDGIFTETHLIVCKNVLIYFNRELQNIVLKKFAESLCYNGFLCLGQKESLLFTAVQDQFVEVDPENKIYQKKYPPITAP